MTEPLIIDGSYGEGGGQILRTSVTLSALTGRPLTFINVRAKRSRPGLQRQHLASVHAAAALCGAQVTGAALNSRAFGFLPGESPAGGPFRFDIGTAGAGTLVAQTVVPMLWSGSLPARVTVTGGTHVPHAPPAEYLEAVYAPLLARTGLDVRVDYPMAGFYPRGGGSLTADVAGGQSPQPLDLTERGDLHSLRAYVITAGLPGAVAERGVAAVKKFCRGIGRQVTVEVRERPSPGQGAAVVVVAECEGGMAGFTSIGERGKPMEQVAREPCEEFLAWWKTGAAVDERLADQLVLPLSLAEGESRWSTPVVSEHLRTVLWVVEQFLPVAHRIEERPGGGVVTLRGVGTIERSG